MTEPEPPVRLVVDASIAAKWLIPEQFTTKALSLRGRPYQLLVPPHLRVEVSNALWKRHRRGDLTLDDARDRVAFIANDRLVEEPATHDDLLPAAFEYASRHDRTIYDALYVALAVSEGCQFVTAERALYNSLIAVYPETLMWIEDVPPGDVSQLL